MVVVADHVRYAPEVGVEDWVRIAGCRAANQVGGNPQAYLALPAAGIGPGVVVLQEIFGSAAITYGDTREDLTACLEKLTRTEVDASASAMRELQSQTAWPEIAKQTLALLER